MSQGSSEERHVRDETQTRCISCNSGFGQKTLNNAIKRGQCTVTVINPVPVIVSIFRNVLIHRVVDIMRVWTKYGMVVRGAMYGKSHVLDGTGNLFRAEKG